MKTRIKEAEKIFKRNHGILKNAQAKRLGIHPEVLRQMVDSGLLTKVSRGIYRLTDLPPLGEPDLTKVSLRVPKGVFCLITALNFHKLSSQIPYRVYIALPTEVKAPTFEYPPLVIIWLSPKSYNAGIDEHELDGVTVRIYCKEKTIADCFKFRNKVGKDVAIEALKDYLNSEDRQVEKLLEYARINRVEKIMRSYIEALV